MKKIFLLLFIAIIGFSCSGGKSVKIYVKNDSAIDRENEIAEISMNNVTEMLGLSDTAQFVILDAQGKQLPYQFTINGLYVSFTVKRKGPLSNISNVL